MWLKNATIYGFGLKKPLPIEQLQAARFTPIGSLALESSGFSPIRDGLLAYQQGKHTLLRFTIEKKHVPNSAVEVILEEKIAELVRAQGFPPGKKARKELKERVIDELLPRALSTRRHTLVWIDQDQGRIVVDSSSSSVCDDVIHALLKAYDIDLGICDVRWPRAAVITSWLDDEPPANFTLDDSIVLQYPGEKGRIVKSDRANVDTADLLDHVQRGAAVQSVAMTFDSRVSFVMTQGMTIRKIKALDVLQEGREAKDDVDRFAGDVELMTRELGVLIDSLVGAA